MAMQGPGEKTVRWHNPNSKKVQSRAYKPSFTEKLLYWALAILFWGGISYLFFMTFF